VSEEVTCTLPEGRQLHLGVFGIDERQHAAIQQRRRDACALFAYLAEERIPTAVNHLFSALTGRRRVADLHLALRSVRLIETRNAMMPAATNAHARLTGQRAGLAGVGGSDAHTLASVARAFTIVRGARTREEYLAGLRAGATIPAGGSGSYARLTADIARLFVGAYADNARRAADDARSALRFATLVAALPLVPLLPLVTAAIYVDELLFGARYARLYRESIEAAAPALGLPGAAAVSR
jgi:hypothetical protein